MKKDSITCALSFFIPVTLMIIILQSMGFYPFGEKSLLIMDMAGQYVRFYEYLPEILRGEGSIFFSWSKAYGSNFIGLFAYYLSSPLSFIMPFFDDVQAGVFWLTVLKIGLCGLSSYFYFRRVCKCEGAAVLIFTTSYALMSYNMVYSLSLMWLDAVIMLPVILLGAEIILRGGRIWLFILSLAALLIANFYTGYMVCIFAVLYTICRYFSTPRSGRKLPVFKALGIFAGSFAAALGLAAWLLLPTFTDLLSGKIGHSGYMPGSVSSFEAYRYILAFLPATYTSIAGNGVPALYTGILPCILCVYFFISRDVRLRLKLCVAALFAVLSVSFYIVKIDIIWHIFQYPNWFPFRYAFVFQFLSVAVGCYAWNRLADKPVRLNLKSVPVCAAVILLVCTDMGINAGGLLSGLDKQFGYKPAEQHSGFRDETEPVIEYIKSTDDGFYRIEKTYFHTLNDALGFGYKGIAHYSSMFSRDLLNVTKRLGMAQTYIWNGYIGSTPFTDSIFGVKYVLSKTSLPYEVLTQSGGVAVYENPYVLPVAFAVYNRDTGLPAGDLSDGSFLSAGNYDCFALQNEIARRLGGRDVFIPAEYEIYTSGDVTGYIIAPAGKPLYAYLPVYRNGNHSLYLNTEPDTELNADEMSFGLPADESSKKLLVRRYTSTDDNNAVYLGTYVDGQILLLTLEDDDTAVNLRGVYIYSLDVEALSELSSMLTAGGLKDIAYGAAYLRGNVALESDGYIFISVPYDEGWTIRVGSDTARPIKALGAFMAVPVSAGEHTFEMSYRPPGLTVGAVITIVTMFIMIIFALLLHKRARNADCARIKRSASLYAALRNAPLHEQDR